VHELQIRHFLSVFPAVIIFYKTSWTKGLPKRSVVNLDAHPDPHHFGYLDPHPDPHQIKIRIRIKIFKLDPEPDPDPHQFADVKPKCMEYAPILAVFQGFEPSLKLGSGSGSASR
jgi:hypothetical protein